MPDQDSTSPAARPPGPLPDGSMPVYGGHPLPGMPGGDPVRPQLGWGPEFGNGRDYFFEHGRTPRARRSGLAVALPVLLVLAAALVVVAIVW
ncbi:hypothetical protein E1218_25880 [Kribbella turkmenica]|uniref:Uncharacterized protein n=1 Tax=Kribbella turkmenica TaxID=2530375 RepID=A0A4R4WPX4_9ACTN|nr:hypothetical protein [Kribbella turkmenica]TDD18535.1 hypothetical protein E1218_25880 [Kribbella turkmenica]